MPGFSDFPSGFENGQQVAQVFDSLECFLCGSIGLATGVNQGSGLLKLDRKRCQILMYMLQLPICLPISPKHQVHSGFSLCKFFRLLREWHGE